MKKKGLIFRFSLMLNIILIIGLMLIGYKLRSKIYNRLFAPSEKTYNIVMLGDGITAGVEWNKDLNRLDIKNNGIPGFTTSHFVWILNDDVIKYNPKICFIQSGLNGIQHGIPLNRIFTNYQSIVDSLLKHQIEPVLQSNYYVQYPSGSAINYPSASETILINSQVDSLNNYLSTLAIKKGVNYIDLNQYFLENGKLKKELSSDGFHLNDHGYKIWTREVDKILKAKGL